MKGFICGNLENTVARVIPESRMDRIAGLTELVSGEVIGLHNIEEYKDRLQDAEIMWCTWGMDEFTSEQIRQYFPRLKALFYCAGSVKHFSRPFLENGIRVFSGWGANAVPVSEFTLSVILLATKGSFRAVTGTRWNFDGVRDYCSRHHGAYHASVGLIGLGMIGSLTAEKLKHSDVDVLAYDPFISDEKAEKLGVKRVDLDTVFTQCDVISNHLADNEKTRGMLDYRLFSKMKPYAAFVNTARGAQVVEKDLARALREVKTRTAFLDVTIREPVGMFNPLYWRSNVIMTPHIAGSLGNECLRMTDYMIEDFLRFSKNEPCRYEVTLKMLETLA